MDKEEGFLGIIITLFIIGITAINVNADYGEGHEIIIEDDYYTIIIPMESRGRLSYVISVQDGYNIDVFLFDEENYADYMTGNSFHYIETGSVLDTRHANVKYILSAGNYYLVIDNTDSGSASPPRDGISGNDYVSFNYKYSTVPNGETFTEDTFTWLSAIVILIGTIVVVVIIILLLVKKKGEKPIPQQQSPQQPYQQPQSPPPAQPSQEPLPAQPYQQPPPAIPLLQQPQTYPCLTCGQPLRYIQAYQRWYCDTCRNYV